MTKSLRLTALAWAAVFTVAACGSATSPTTAPSRCSPVDRCQRSARVLDPRCDRRSRHADREGHRGRQAARLDRPGLCPLLVTEQATGTFEGFDISTAEIAKRLNVSVGKDIQIDGRPRLVPHHRGQLGRPLGHQRGLDERSPPAARRSLTSPTRTTTTPADCRPDAFDHHVDRRPERKVRLRRRGDHVRAVAPRNARLRGPLTCSSRRRGSSSTSLPTDKDCIQALAAGRKFDAIVANEGDLANAVTQNLPIMVLRVSSRSSCRLRSRWTRAGRRRLDDRGPQRDHRLHAFRRHPVHLLDEVAQQRLHESSVMR